MKYKIRRATLKDYKPLALLYEEFDKFNTSNKEKSTKVYTQKEYEIWAKSQLKIRESQIYIAFENKQPVGYMHFYEIRPAQQVYLDDLFTREKYRGKGIGKAFLNLYIKYAKAKKLNMELSVYKWNKKAMKIYKSFGFKEDTGAIFFNKSYK